MVKFSHKLVTQFNVIFLLRLRSLSIHKYHLLNLFTIKQHYTMVIFHCILRYCVGFIGIRQANYKQYRVRFIINKREPSRAKQRDARGIFPCMNTSIVEVIRVIHLKWATQRFVGPLRRTNVYFTMQSDHHNMGG